ncbi:DnaJ domain-containing protein [uncultured Sphingomonas sp.]|uniref:J domain-containing protein n=1 Tax=uncultured Sphingomonas sp. TaxID=158754 RepID=UPI0025E49CCE|nr:DnaJ domain-containing protein [uncultured Sphingomonas sp.]
MKLIVAALAIWLLWWFLKKPPERRPGAIATARRTLGVAADADAEAIRAAHRRLIAELHPDRGGSAEEARRVNAARDLLLARVTTPN